MSEPGCLKMITLGRAPIFDTQAIDRAEPVGDNV